MPDVNVMSAHEFSHLKAENLLNSTHLRPLEFYEILVCYVGSKFSNYDQQFDALHTALNALQQEINQVGFQNKQQNQFIKGILLAPEYFFRKTYTYTKGCYEVSNEDLALIIPKLLALSSEFPEILMIPGTLLIKQPIAEVPLNKISKGLNNLENAIQNDAGKITNFQNNISRSELDPFFQNASYNECSVILDGEIIHKYDKQVPATSDFIFKSLFIAPKSVPFFKVKLDSKKSLR